MSRIALILSSMMLLSCAPEPKEESPSLQTLEQKYKKSGSEQLADSLIVLYSDYYKANPTDSLSPHYMIKCADLLKETKTGAQRAIHLYDSLLNQYPQHQLSSRALFMKAYTYDEVLGNKDESVKYYQSVISDFPKSRYAQEAQNLITLITDSLTEEEIVNIWLKENKDSNQE